MKSSRKIFFFLFLHAVRKSDPIWLKSVNNFEKKWTTGLVGITWFREVGAESPGVGRDRVSQA